MIWIIWYGPYYMVHFKNLLSIWYEPYHIVALLCRRPRKTWVKIKSDEKQTFLLRKPTCKEQWRCGFQTNCVMYYIPELESNCYDNFLMQTPRAGEFFIRNSPFKSFFVCNFGQNLAARWRDNVRNFSWS